MSRRFPAAATGPSVFPSAGSTGPFPSASPAHIWTPRSRCAPPRFTPSREWGGGALTAGGRATRTLPRAGTERPRSHRDPGRGRSRRTPRAPGVPRAPAAWDYISHQAPRPSWDGVPRPRYRSRRASRALPPALHFPSRPAPGQDSASRHAPRAGGHVLAGAAPRGRGAAAAAGLGSGGKASGLVAEPISPVRPPRFLHKNQLKGACAQSLQLI